MKILLAVDDSAYSDRATSTLRALQLPTETEVTVMTVVPEYTFLGEVGLHMLSGMAGSKERAHQAQQKKAAELLHGPLEALRDSGLKAESLVCRGRPAEEIIKTARKLGAHLIVIGAKGAGGPHRFPLGSVTYTVMTHAGTSVLLAREKATIIRRVLIALDGSRYADSVVQLLLNLPLHPSTEVVLVVVLQSYTPALVELVTKDWKVDEHILLELQQTEEESAKRLMGETKAQFREKGYQVSSMVFKGAPADQILTAAEKLDPDMIALGAIGRASIQGLLVGSVAQRVARFSTHSVLLGRAQSDTSPSNKPRGKLK